MSSHLMGCAKHPDGWSDVRLPPRPGREETRTLGPSHRLALIAFADSADDRTRVGFPGLEGVIAWTGCASSTAKELVADLVEAGYLTPHRKSAPGRRAEYIVFPHGCCAQHRVPAADTGPEPSIEDAIRVLQAAGVEIPPTPDRSDTSDPNRYDPSDPSHGDRYDPSDPSQGTATQRVRPVGPVTENGSTTGTTRRPPSISTNNPPSPPPGGGTCVRCSTGKPCRAHGTTARQIAAAERRTATDQARLAAQEHAAAQTRAAKAAAASPETTRRRVAQARAEIARRAG